MNKIYNWIEEYIPLAVFVIISIVMLLQVIMRTIFGISFAWSVEVSQYLNVWVTFIGIGYLRKINAHIKIEMFYDWFNKKLTPSWQLFFFIVKKILNILFMVALIWLGLQLSIRSWNFRSAGLQIRQTWLYICVPLGGLGYLIREIESIYHVVVKHKGASR
ncbi:MAG: TRAP transporter small permease [Sphaerochaeta sp.]|nr:TRAP transporter small permease [Sphaerochaeta sp.]